MGITGLKKLIQENAPDAIEDIPLSACKGLRAAIDTSILTYQLGSASQTATDDASRWRTFRRLAIGRMKTLNDLKITAVFVFDGEPPAIKEYELARRRALLGSIPTITDEHFAFMRQCATAAGFQCVDAPSEAEAQCARMCRDGLVDVVITEDGDALTHGAPVVLFGFKGSARTVKKITLARVLTGLQLTMPAFIDMCILLGCDYGPTLTGIGPKKAIQYMREHGSITKMIKAKSILVTPPTFRWIMPHKAFTEHETTVVHIVAPPSDPAFLARVLAEDYAAAAMNATADAFDDE